MKYARDKMLDTMLWAFYVSNYAIAQKLNISQQPTITTTTITWFSEFTGKLTIIPYNFFEI